MEYNKKFEYEGYVFNIKVETDTKLGDRVKVDGEVWNRVTINDMGTSNFYRTFQTTDDLLEGLINQFSRNAKEYVDNRNNPKTDIEKLLTGMGFKN